MAGITLFKKTAFAVFHLTDRLLDPQVRYRLFDDNYGQAEIAALLGDPKTWVWGIMEKGRPEPAGVVFFSNVNIYRDCTMYACIFNKDNRNKGKLQEVIPDIEKDLLKRACVHSISAYTIGENAASRHLLKKNGFRLVGVKKEGILSKGKYRDLYCFYKGYFPEWEKDDKEK